MIRRKRVIGGLPESLIGRGKVSRGSEWKNASGTVRSTPATVRSTPAGVHDRSSTRARSDELELSDRRPLSFGADLKSGRCAVAPVFHGRHTCPLLERTREALCIVKSHLVR